MENYPMSLEATTSKVLPKFKQEGQPKNQSSEDEQNGPKYVACHLCAVDVPRCFIMEHYRSNKHKINTKIAAVALERIKKSLDCNIISDIDRTEALYFCPQCMITLNPKDRQRHDKSLAHKKALTVDKFLHDFYVLYSIDERDSDVDECEAVTVEANNVEERNEIKNISPNNEQSTTINLLHIPEKIKVKFEDSIGNTNNHIIESYPILKNDKIDNSCVTKVQEIPNKTIKSEVNTNPYNDLQFCTIGQNKCHIFCKLCKVYVPNNRGNVMSHQKGSKHKDLLQKINKTH